MKETEHAVVQSLRTHDLFSGLSDAQHARLLPALHIREFSDGQMLFQQNEQAPAFFVLYSGTVKLYRVSNDGHEKIMRLIEPGQSFAESVMFMDAPRYLVNAGGLNAGVLVAIDAAAYLEILQDSFVACRAVLANLTQRIEAHWDEIEALSLQNSRYRVVHYLLSLASDCDAGPTTVRLPATKSLIAAKIAVTPETLSRILRLLQDEDLIEMQGHDLHIPNLVSLREQLMA
ncbi:Crp/Fnr family transcriptional regulator [Salinisphaera hydrothermalis]|uniref:Crp/Fnr family transcriptional regulator n=1 Tax=Salinisphaera hydrothermalis TaxID=563188 RepID=UPI00333EFB19